MSEETTTTTVEGGAVGGGAAQPRTVKELHEAAKKGDLEKVNELLLAKADVNEVDHLKRTPLHLATYFGHEAVTCRLLAAGSVVNAAAIDSITPLHFAAQTGQVACARALLDHVTKLVNDNNNNANGGEQGKANEDGVSQPIENRFVTMPLVVNAVDSKKRFTPLHFAAKGGHSEVVVLLLAKGADPALRSKSGESAGDMATGGCTKLLPSRRRSAKKRQEREAEKKKAAAEAGNEKKEEEVVEGENQQKEATEQKEVKIDETKKKEQIKTVKKDANPPPKRQRIGLTTIGDDEIEDDE